MVGRFIFHWNSPCFGDMLVFGGVTHQRSLFTCNLAYTPGKINFPNLNISQLKLEDNLPNLHFFGSVLVFGCIQRLNCCSRLVCCSNNEVSRWCSTSSCRGARRVSGGFRGTFKSFWRIHPQSWKWWFLKGISFSRGWFSGSMLNFGGVPETGNKSYSPF